MESKVLICPDTYEAWVKMHTNDQGKKRVEILAPRLIKRFTTRGMAVPTHLRTQEMKNNKIHFLKLDDLEKDSEFFTSIFLKTVCKTQLLKDRFYWKNASDYINAATEEQEEEERIQETIAALKECCAEAEARGTTFSQEFFDRTRGKSPIVEQEIFLNPLIKNSTQQLTDNKAPFFKTQVEVPTEEIEKLSIQEGKDPGISKKVSKTPSRSERFLRIDAIATQLINAKNKANTSSIPMSGSKA
ncbi:hypothetical protein [Rhabdochlamydiaceae symbiont of Dictyostelium giganteum]|uniref:hypothetical protein n=1 Tax=Rhabdochlamydiaceae symbiont of Dictyostelium giganteum TaxID=3342349 RepID=UPI00384D1A2D